MKWHVVGRFYYAKSLFTTKDTEDTKEKPFWF
jgi:hypothetical protein